MELLELVAYLDNYLNHERYTDSSLNGLQVEGRSEVATIALAVDASQAAIDQAVEQGADLLLTHHGLFWGRPTALCGMMGRRVKRLMQADVSLYVSHLPLDAHPEVGNNAELVRLLGLAGAEPFGEYRGATIGFIAQAEPGLRLSQLVERITTQLGTPAAEMRVWGEPAGLIKRIGIISGGAASSIEEAIAAGCDAFITGEPSYGSLFPAIEQQVPLICAGHYYTETVGLQALGRQLEAACGVSTFFIAEPVGL